MGNLWIVVGQGPIALAVDAGGGCLDIFSLVYFYSFLSPSLHCKKISEDFTFYGKITCIQLPVHFPFFFFFFFTGARKHFQESGTVR